MKKVIISCALLVNIVACTSNSSDPQPAVPATFAISRTIVEVNEAVVFSEASTKAARYAWDFGNGQTATDAAPSMKYAVPGTYTVSLTTYSADNQATSTSQTIKVGKRYLRDITITALPFLAPDGTPWDTGGSGPDVYVQLRSNVAGDTVFTRTPTTSNVTPANLPLAFAVRKELTPGEWEIVVRDEDSGSNDTMRRWTLPVGGPTADRDAQGNGSYTLSGPPESPATWAVTLRYETR